MSKNSIDKITLATEWNQIQNSTKHKFNNPILLEINLQTKNNYLYKSVRKWVDLDINPIRKEFIADSTFAP